MFLARPKIPRVLLLVVVEVLYAAPAAGEVVYENTSMPLSTGSYAPNGFWPFSAYAPNEPTGDEIALAGTSRFVTQFDLVLSSSEPTMLTVVALAFYRLDPNTSMPEADDFWSATSENVLVDGPTTLTFAVDPAVLVPDSFVWAASADSLSAGLGTCDPPSIGSSADYFWDRDTYTLGWYALWFESDPVGNFGARVEAIPEPASVAWLAAGIPWIRKRRRRVRTRVGGP